MDAQFVPVIRLSVERMKDAVIQHMGVFGSDLGEVIETEMQKQIDSFDTEELVKKAVQEAISDEIASLFQYGEGRKIIQHIVSKSLSIPYPKEEGEE